MADLLLAFTAGGFTTAWVLALRTVIAGRRPAPEDAEK